MVGSSYRSRHSASLFFPIPAKGRYHEFQNHYSTIPSGLSVLPGVAGRGRIVLDLGNIQGVEWVEADIYETHFPGSTRGFMYLGSEQVSYFASFQEGLQTIFLPINNGDMFAISAHEAYVFEIRLIGDNLVANETIHMSDLKGMYR